MAIRWGRPVSHDRYGLIMTWSSSCWWSSCWFTVCVWTYLPSSPPVMWSSIWSAGSSSSWPESSLWWWCAWFISVWEDKWDLVANKKHNILHGASVTIFHMWVARNQMSAEIKGFGSIMDLPSFKRCSIICQGLNGNSSIPRTDSTHMSNVFQIVLLFYKTVDCC